MPHLCGYWGGGANSIVLAFLQLHRSGFNLKIETLFESISQVVADLWQRKGKISGGFKNSTSVVLPQCQDKVLFQRKDTGIISKSSSHLFEK